MILRFPDDVELPLTIEAARFVSRKINKELSFKEYMIAAEKFGDFEIPFEGYKIGDGFIKNKSGIYAFVKVTSKADCVPIYKRIMYLGKAKKIRNRLQKHLIYSPDIYNKMIDNKDDAFEIYVWYLDNPEQYERKIIEKIKPKYNTEFNRPA
jgi:hypothetical protein